MEIKERKINELTPADYNPRKLTEDQFNQIKESLEKFGFVDPVVVNVHEDRNGVIVGGHQRVKVAKSIGLETVPTVEVYLDEAEEKELNVRLNKASGEWDWCKLVDEFEKSDLLDWGFSEEDFADLIKDDTEPEEVEATEPPENPKTELGRIYQLGNHRLMCGDSTSEEDVARLMDGEKADMVFTDPPYGVDYDGGAKTKRTKLANDHCETDIYDDVIPVLFDATKDTAPFYIWHAAGFADMASKIAGNGLSIRAQIIWNKNIAQFGALSAQYKQKHEPCFYCFKKGFAPIWEGPTNEVTVWEQDRESKNEFHPTQKPVELAFRAIKNHNPDSVLDLFGGSGSTLIACEQLNRSCRMMELDPKYCDVIVKRYAECVGADPDEIFETFVHKP